MSEEIFSKEQIEEKLTSWEIDEDKIEKEFIFADFRGSLDFVNKVANLAEKANHHPEIEIHYNKVEIELSTHSVGGVTQKDIDLANEIDKI